MSIVSRLRNFADSVLPSRVSLLNRVADGQAAHKFDRRWYLKTYPDVVAAGVDPLTHFMRHGEAEGRNPNPGFSTNFYRKTYMRGEPAEASPWSHYLAKGRGLGYDTMPPTTFDYAQFVAAEELVYGTELPELWRHIPMMVLKPLFLIYFDADTDAAADAAKQMLQNQIYHNWVFCRNRDEVYAASKGVASDEWCLVWLDQGVILHSSALYRYASQINENPRAILIYADEDEVDELGHRAKPFLKPDWSPDYFEAYDFIGTGACVSGIACRSELKPARDYYDFLLRVTETPGDVVHIRQTLVHRAVGLPGVASQSQIRTDICALEGRLARTGRVGVVTAIRADRRCYSIRLDLRHHPMVSIVIPTAGKIVEIAGKKTDLLFNCLDHVSARTSYPNLEVIVIHNDNLGEERMAALAGRGVTLLAYSGDFNVARKLNIGAKASHGEYLLLLNDDIEPITADWIERLLEHFEKPHVGVVGAKLLFPSMQIQHAGVVMIDGKPEHLRFKYPRNDEGYFFSTCTTRNFSAVTGAVMLTPAALFRELGGYTEELPVNFNDVDYCLKASRAGYSIVYTPEAELVHYESMSRVRQVFGEEIEYFEKAWADFVTDPYYNEHMLNKRPANYQLTSSTRQIG